MCKDKTNLLKEKVEVSQIMNLGTDYTEITVEAGARMEENRVVCAICA